MTPQTQRRRRRASLAAVLAVLVAALLAPAATAAITVGVTGTAPRQVLTVTSDGSSDVVLSFFPDPISGPGVAVSGGDEPVVVGAGCTAGSTPERAECGVVADLERVVFAGGDGPDGLRVTSATPLLPIEATGAGGDDDLSGGSGADVLSGGPGDDVLIGGVGDDRLLGGEGDDQLDGGLGADALFGEAGVDDVFGGPGADALDGGGDDDVVDSRDGTADAPVGCGDGGGDILVADNTQDLAAGNGCETVAPQFHGPAAIRVFGIPRAGQILQYAGADLTGTPATLAFQWVQCGGRFGCQPIPGATGPAHLLPPVLPRGPLLTVALQVTATNAGGTAAGTSGPIEIGPPLPPPPAPPPAPPAGAAPVLTPAPAVAGIRSSRRAAITSRRGVRRLDTGRVARCPRGRPACRVTVVATVRRSARGPAFTLARGTVVIPGAASRRLAVRLTERGLAALRARRVLRVALLMTSTRGAAPARRVRATVTVRAPRSLR